MIILDKAQRKLLAGYMEKFAVALATAISAKVFFSEEGMTMLTLYAAAFMVIILVLGLILVHGTEEKPNDTMRTEVKKGIFHVNNAEIKR